MRDTIITRAAELMSDMQLFATNDVSPQENNDSESAGGPNRENTAELTHPSQLPPPDIGLVASCLIDPHVR